MTLKNIQIEESLIKKTKAIAKRRNPLRKIGSNAEAIRTALIFYIEQNQALLDTKKET